MRNMEFSYSLGSVEGAEMKARAKSTKNMYIERKKTAWMNVSVKNISVDLDHLEFQWFSIGK